MTGCGDLVCVCVPLLTKRRTYNSVERRRWSLDPRHENLSKSYLFSRMGERRSEVYRFPHGETYICYILHIVPSAQKLFTAKKTRQLYLPGRVAPGWAMYSGLAGPKFIIPTA